MEFVTTELGCETHVAVEGSKRNHVINVGLRELHASPSAPVPFDRALIDFTRAFYFIALLRLMRSYT